MSQLPDQPVDAPLSAEKLKAESGGFAVGMLLVAIGLTFLLDNKYLLVPWQWMLPFLETVLAIMLIAFKFAKQHGLVRKVSIVVLTLLTVGNATSAVMLDRSIIVGEHVTAGALLSGALIIWVTNVIAFAQMYWELDAGGPWVRAHVGKHHLHPDFLFPQMSTAGIAHRGWRPTYGDYLYTSLTNATAFSPTDTMPLTYRAKGAMAVQSIIALITSVLVVARAVNIL